MNSSIISTSASSTSSRVRRRRSKTPVGRAPEEAGVAKRARRSNDQSRSAHTQNRPRTASDCRQCGKPFYQSSQGCSQHRRQGVHFLAFAGVLVLLCCLLLHHAFCVALLLCMMLAVILLPCPDAMLGCPVLCAWHTCHLFNVLLDIK